MTLEELTEPLTREEIEEDIYEGITALGGAPTTWKTGAPTRTIITIFAVILSGLSRLSAKIAKSGFLALSSGDWLTLVAKYVYGVDRITGTYAAGNVEIDNSGAGVFSFAPGTLTVVNPTSGKAYRNLATINIAAMQQNVLASMQAVEIGSTSTSLAGTITAFMTPYSGLTVTNPAALIGTDAEKDAALKDRCLEKTGTLSPNGPKDAYAFVAKAAKKSDGVNAGVTRVRTVATGSGGVTVYCATASGNLTGTLGVLSTPLGAVDDAIQTLAAPLAVTATTASATARAIAVTYQVWVRNTSGKTDAEITTAINDALTAFLQTAPIGGHKIAGESTGRIYKGAIEAAIDAALRALVADDEDVDPVDFIVRRVVSTPAGDTDLAISEAPAVGAFVATITQVADGTVSS